jgi:hypothetical protein
MLGMMPACLVYGQAYSTADLAEGEQAQENAKLRKAKHSSERSNHVELLAGRGITCLV